MSISMFEYVKYLDDVSEKKEHVHRKINSMRDVCCIRHENGKVAVAGDYCDE